MSVKPRCTPTYESLRATSPLPLAIASRTVANGRLPSAPSDCTVGMPARVTSAWVGAPAGAASR